MHGKRWLVVAAAALCLCGCAENEERARERKAKPTFLFWCFRKEIVASEYRVPGMKSPEAAAYLQERLKAVPGHEGSTVDLEKNTITVRYQGSTVRRMNFEQAIAQAGFAVDFRPADPNAKVPEGVR